MKRGLRRMVSLLCVFALCAGLLPMTALAVPEGGQELDQSYYNKNSYVFWDTMNATVRNGEITGGSSDHSNSSRISSVTLNGQTVVNGNSGSTSWNMSGVTQLERYFDDADTSHIQDGTLVITPAEGYYVTGVVIACCSQTRTQGSSTITGSSPYSCNTWDEGNAFTESFSVGSSGAVEISLDSEDFSHRSGSGVYFILISVSPIPTPLYVEYNYGDIATILGDGFSESVFASASGWMTVNSGNVYTGSDTTTGGGMQTANTQFMYTYNNGTHSTESASSWRHFANTVTDEAKAAAATEGYYFAGWSVEYYTDVTVTEAADGSYNNYNYAFDASSKWGDGTCDEGDRVYLYSNVKLTAIWKKLDIGVTKTATAGSVNVDNATVAAGTNITYTVTVTNTGDSAQSNVAVTDGMFPTGGTGVTIQVNGTTAAARYGTWSGQTYTINSLAKNDVVTFTYTYKTTGNETDGKVSNTVTVKVGGIEVTDGTKTDVVKLDATKAPVTADSVELTGGTTLTAGRDYTKVTATTEGGETTYSAYADADGNATILYAVQLSGFDGAVFTVSDAGATYKGYSGAAASVTGSGPYTVTLSGNTATLYFAMEVTGATNTGTTVTNTATVNGGEVPSEEVTVTKTVKHIKIEKSVSVTRDGKTVTLGKDDMVKEYDVLTYTITVTNDGTVDLSGVTITDTFNGSAAPTNSNPSVTWAKNADDEFEATWTISSLAVGADATLTYTYTVQADDKGNTLTNTASVGGDVAGEDGEVEVTVEDPKLTVTKSAQEESVKVGQAIHYTITVTNTGNMALTGVTVNDAMFASADNGSVAIKVNGSDPAAGYGTWSADSKTYTISSLAEDAVVTFTYSYTTTEGDVDGGVTNTVTVDADEIPEGSDPIEATETVDVNKLGLSVTKSAKVGNTEVTDSTIVKVDDTITYTITVTNTGNVDLNNVVVTDTLWGGKVTSITVSGVDDPVTVGSAGYTIASLPATEGSNTVTITYAYTVTDADAGGKIENTATATAPDGPADTSQTVTVTVEDNTPVTPPIITPPPVLNTKDHVAYIIGYPDGTVRPDGNITRAEVATIFFRLLTDEARETYWSQTNPYSDVPAESWFNNAISTLSNMGIIDGYPDGTFRPDAYITRAELTKIAVSFFSYADGYVYVEGTYPDVSGDQWFARFVAAAQALGLIEGYPDGTFRPDNYITRAETCTIVNRTLGRKPHEDHLLSQAVMITWPDNLEGAWYYEDMQEATNSHDYTWTTEDGEAVERWTAKLEERDWAALEKMWSNAHSAPGGEVMG